jgi:hypothetical protein
MQHPSIKVKSYTDEIVGDHKRGFRRNKSTTDKIYYSLQVLERTWKYNETVHQLAIHRRKQRLTVIDNRLLRTISGPKGDEVAGG